MELFKQIRLGIISCIIIIMLDIINLSQLLNQERISTFYLVPGFMIAVMIYYGLQFSIVLFITGIITGYVLYSLTNLFLLLVTSFFVTLIYTGVAAYLKKVLLNKNFIDNIIRLIGLLIIVGTLMFAVIVLFREYTTSTPEITLQGQLALIFLLGIFLGFFTMIPLTIISIEILEHGELLEPGVLLHDKKLKIKNYMSLAIYNVIVALLLVQIIEYSSQILLILFFPIFIIAIRYDFRTSISALSITNFFTYLIFLFIGSFDQYESFIPLEIIFLQLEIIIINVLILTIGLATNEIIIERNRREKAESDLQHFQKQEAIGQMAGGIAHDFNNYIQVIAGHTELIKHVSDENEEVRSSLDAILNVTTRAANLTKQLLTISKKQISEFENSNINTIIVNNQEIIISLVGEKYTITWSLEKNLPDLRLDKNQIEQILINLISNAKDAMVSGGNIIIRTSIITIDENKQVLFSSLDPGTYILLSVEDNGIGIERDQLENIFEPYFTNKPEGKGIGLGLSLVLSNVTNHGGKLEVISKPNIGTKFMIYFPVVLLSNVKNDHAIVENKEYENELNKSIKKILVVDNEPEILSLVKGYLSETDVEVDIFDDPKKAINTNIGDVDVVISDILMPEIDGYSLIKSFKEKHHRIGAVLISGYRGQYFNSNENTSSIVFLEKPFNRVKLFAAINASFDLLQSNSDQVKD